MATEKATRAGGGLNPIENCQIFVPGFGPIVMDALPEISDS